MDRTLANADIAFQCGADGVFLLSMDGHDAHLADWGVEVKASWPDKLVGLNVLTMNTHEALATTADAGLDMTWANNAHVGTGESPQRAQAIARTLAAYPGHLFFGGVAFKYQLPEAFPSEAALRAAELGFIPTTSGPSTGAAADITKIRLMRSVLKDRPLAVASGITPENVTLFTPYVTHILVATGVSANEFDLDPEKLNRLISAVRKPPRPA